MSQAETELLIRGSAQADLPELMDLYPAAFPDEDLVPLVRELLRDQRDVHSLVGVVDGRIAAHVLFTVCAVENAHERAALLGPLAVTPGRQRTGCGRALIGAGLKRLEAEGVPRALVLGDPAYYGRFGFEPEARITPPYPLPEEWRDAWRSVRIGDAAADAAGRLVTPTPWRRPELWGAGAKSDDDGGA